MTDKDLTKFLPKIGDRVSLKIFIEEIKDKKRKPKSTILRALRQKGEYMDKILRAAVQVTKARQFQNLRNRQDLTWLEWEIGFAKS